MTLGNDNLNMLIPLNALLAHKSVTGAAKALHVGQPAMSAALSKLRDHYHDELLMRVDNAYELTPLAESLVEMVAVALELGGQALRMDGHTAIPEMHRNFTIGMSEYEFDVLAPEVLRRIHSTAPHVTVTFDMNSARHMNDIANHLRGLDCMTMPSDWLSGFPRARLFEDDLLLAVSGSHPMPSTGSTREHLEDLRWVASGDNSFVRAAMHDMFDFTVEDSNVLATTDSLYGLIATVARTDLACVLPRRSIAAQLDSGELREILPSVRDRSIAIDLFWHPVRTRERGLDWLRRTIVEAAQSLDTADAGLATR